MKGLFSEFNESEFSTRDKKDFKRFKLGYAVVGVFTCLSLLIILLYTILYLPPVGKPDNPVDNEVAIRYVEEGTRETGAVNTVTGMILDYRAFDTFGESCVLFTATCCVTVLLRIQDNRIEKNKNKRELMYEHLYELRNDKILQGVSTVLIPILLMFGIYVILNGHLSPGGGFSGGTIMGAAMILYHTAFGTKMTRKVLNGKRIRILTLCALMFYCLAKSYSFFTGANHLKSIIKIGTIGNIISSGLILPLNICVGIVVACTMYSFFALFKRSEL